MSEIPSRDFVDLLEIAAVILTVIIAYKIIRWTYSDDANEGD